MSDPEEEEVLFLLAGNDGERTCNTWRWYPIGEIGRFLQRGDTIEPIENELTADSSEIELERHVVGGEEFAIENRIARCDAGLMKLHGEYVFSGDEFRSGYGIAEV